MAEQHIPEPHDVTDMQVLVLDRAAWLALSVALTNHGGEIIHRAHNERVAAAGYCNFLVWPTPLDEPLCVVMEYDNATG